METYTIDNQTWTRDEVEEQAYEYMDLNNERDSYLGRGWDDDITPYLRCLSDYGHKVVIQ
tara:strand:- start:776 stop:955 length:180 start_codon:yes stop_codon:yes gene_type:complete